MGDEMISSIKYIFLCLLLFMFSGCASAPKRTQYADLATIGSKYTDSINAVVDLASTIQIDDGSYSLLRHSIKEVESFELDLNDDGTGLKKQELESELLSRITKKVETRNKTDMEFLAVYGVYKKFNNLLGAYFQRVSMIANSSEPEELGKQLNSSLTNVSNLIKTISDKEHLKLSADDLEKVSGVTQYLVDKKIEGVLARRINADSLVIKSALEIQKRMLNVLSTIISEKQKSILKFKIDNLLSPDLITVNTLLKDQKQRAKLISNRREWLTAEIDITKINETSTLAPKLNDLLEKLVKGESDYLVTLTNLVDRLEELDKLTSKLKN